MEVHTLEPTLFYLFHISLHVLPKRSIYTIPIIVVLCTVMFLSNLIVIPTANFTVHEILVNIFTCTKLSK